MPIEMKYDSGNPSLFGGTGEPWRGSRNADCSCGKCQVTFGYGSDFYEFETVAVHEVGHALGLRHERSRPDFPGCTSVDPPYDVNPSSRVESGPLLTKSWDVCSIMAEWPCCDYRKHDSVSFYWLSDGDRLGINILYPKQLTGRTTGSVSSRLGFTTSGGVVVRANGSVTTDWTAGGAADSVFKTQPAWYARRAGYADVYLATRLDLPVSYLSGKTYSSVYFSYTDTFSRNNNGAAPVVVSNARHTAILASALVRI